MAEVPQIISGWCFSQARLLIVLCLSRKHLPAVAIVYSSCNSNNDRRVKTTFNFLQCTGANTGS